MAKKEQIKSLQELTVLNPVLKPSLIKFEMVKSQLEEVAKSCLLIKVTDPASLTVCENNLSKVNDLCNAVEAVRIAEKAPHFANCKAIDAAAAYVVDLPESAVAYLKLEKKTYILKEEAEKKRLEGLQAKVDAMAEYMKAQFDAIEDVATLDAFVERIQLINFIEKYEDYSEQAKTISESYIKLFAIKRIELEALLTATPEEALEIKEEAEKAKELVQEIVVEAKAESVPFGYANIKKVRRPWAFEVVDATKVPKEWLMLDESKVKEWLKVNSENLVDGQTLSGIKYFKDLTITA